MPSSPTPVVSAPAAVLLALVLGLVGCLVDVLTGQGLRLLFGVCFVGGCALAALVVQRRGLGVVAVMPPLAYVVIALVAGAVQGGASTGSFVVRQALELFTTLVLGAPTLLLASAVTLAIALVRGLGHRRRTRPSEPGPARQRSLVH